MEVSAEAAQPTAEEELLMAAAATLRFRKYQS